MNTFLNPFKILILAAFVFATACDDNDEPSVNDLKRQAITNYADIVYATYDDSYKAAETLKTKIDAFVSAPTAAGLEECKSAWKAARIPYGQTEAFRFYGGPIDDEDGPEGLINAWPIDENFIDYVEGNTDAGLINDPTTYPTISKAVLEDLNESISETSIFTGYHAIEFLLWGQDLNVSGPGSRPYTDFISGASGTAANQQRRGQYLKVVTELLLDHLASVKEEWKDNGTYRNSFVNNPDVLETISKIFTGMGELSKGELAGERMLVAVETQDQENEHSCFSDNTHIDIKMNFQSVKNVYTGSYTRTDGTIVSGTSFKQIAERLDKTKADAVMESFADAEAKINLIPAPFDQAIMNSQSTIIPASQSLSLLSDRLSDVALALD
jgi:putative iron-regulated protein